MYIRQGEIWKNDTSYLKTELAANVRLSGIISSQQINYISNTFRLSNTNLDGIYNDFFISCLNVRYISAAHWLSRHFDDGDWECQQNEDLPWAVKVLAKPLDYDCLQF